MSAPESDKISEAFGVVLQRYRVDAGISQEELADLANVDRTFVSRLERGLRQPTITTIISLAQALKVTATELVREVEAALPRGGRGR